MHIYMLQLETDKDDALLSPITADTIINETNFIGSVADYVSEDIDRYESIVDFLSYLKKYTSNVSITFNTDHEYYSIIFHEGFKDDYFKKSFNEFRSKASSLTMQDFLRSSTIYEFEKLLTSDDYYIFNEGRPIKIGDFLRYIKEEQEYYIGGILDCHI